MEALGNNFIPFVQSGPWGRPMRCASSPSYRGGRFSPTCWTMAQGWGWTSAALVVGCLLILQLPDVAYESRLVHACGGWRRPCLCPVNLSLKVFETLRWVQCTAWWYRRPQQWSCSQGWWSCTSPPAGRVMTCSCSPWSPCGLMIQSSSCCAPRLSESCWACCCSWTSQYFC